MWMWQFGFRGHSLQTPCISCWFVVFLAVRALFSLNGTLLLLVLMPLKLVHPRFLKHTRGFRLAIRSPRNGWNVMNGFQVRMPNCQMGPVSRAHPTRTSPIFSATVKFITGKSCTWTESDSPSIFRQSNYRTWWQLLCIFGGERATLRLRLLGRKLSQFSFFLSFSLSLSLSLSPSLSLSVSLSLNLSISQSLSPTALRLLMSVRVVPR